MSYTQTNLQTLRYNNSILTHERNVLQKQVNELKEKLVDLEEENENLNTTIQSLQQKVKEDKTTIDNLNTSIDTLTTNTTYISDVISAYGLFNTLTSSSITVLYTGSKAEQYKPPYYFKYKYSNVLLNEITIEYNMLEIQTATDTQGETFYVLAIDPTYNSKQNLQIYCAEGAEYVGAQNFILGALTYSEYTGTDYPTISGITRYNFNVDTNDHVLTPDITIQTTDLALPSVIGTKNVTDTTSNQQHVSLGSSNISMKLKISTIPNSTANGYVLSFNPEEPLKIYL